MAYKATIGFCIRPSKRKDFNWDDGFIPAANAQGYNVIPFDASDLSVPVDIVIAKLTDFIIHVDTDNECKQLIDRFQEFERSKKAPLIDPVESQLAVSNRLTACQKIEQFRLNPEVWENPKFCVVENPEELYSKIQDNGIEFPLMIKSVVACATKASHEMGIVFNKAQLEKHMFFPCMLQSYFNHNGVLYKVAAIGDDITQGIDRSIRNLTEDEEPIWFDSQKMGQLLDLHPHTSDELLPLEPLQEAAKQIQEVMGLSLYGFDVIRNSATGKLALIDINFFPSYRRLSDVFPRLLKFFDLRLGFDKQQV